MTKKSVNEDWGSNEKYQKDPTVPLVSNSNQRSYTPLPELIIEKVPPPHNDADEEIDIEQFTIRMRKLHRRLFNIKSENKEDSDWSDTTFFVQRNDKSVSRERNKNEDSFSLRKSSASKEDIDNEKKDGTCNNSTEESKSDGVISLNSEEVDETEKKTFDQVSEEFEEECSAESTQDDYESDNNESLQAMPRIKGRDSCFPNKKEFTQDEVEEPKDDAQAIKYEFERFNRGKLSTISEETELGSVSTSLLKITEKNIKGLRDGLNDSLYRTYDKPTALRTSIASLLSFERHEIEAMRGIKHARSELFQNNSILNKSFIVHDSSEEQISNEHIDPVVMGIESTYADSYKLENIVQRSSTLNCERNDHDQQYRFSIDEFDEDGTVQPTKRQLIETENTFTVRKKSKVDCSVQTEVDVNNVGWWEKKNLILGVPKVFNLCSCRNHKCS